MRFIVRKKEGMGAQLPLAMGGTWCRYMTIPERECCLSPWGNVVAVDSKEKARRFKQKPQAVLFALKIIQSAPRLRGFIEVEEVEVIQ